MRQGRRNQRLALGGPVGVKYVLDLLEKKTGRAPTWSGHGQWSARCAGHADSDPSLSVAEADDGSVLLHCHAGCEPESIAKALGLEFRHLGPTRPARQAPQLQATTQRATIAAQPQFVTAPDSEQDWAALVVDACKSLTEQAAERLAEQLGVGADDMRLLGLGMTRVGDEIVYTWPERDAQGRIVGVATRSMNGAKGFIAGGKRGLTIAPGWHTGTHPIPIVEGPTDVAALLYASLPGIGRPSANGGGKLLAELLSCIPAERPIVIVAEFDPRRDGRWPGRDGAQKVARELADALGRKVQITYPPAPHKDVREWLTSKGATR
jgi:hypothetical protein